MFVPENIYNSNNSGYGSVLVLYGNLLCFLPQKGYELMHILIAYIAMKSELSTLVVSIGAFVYRWNNKPNGGQLSGGTNISIALRNVIANLGNLSHM